MEHEAAIKRNALQALLGPLPTTPGQQPLPEGQAQTDATPARGRPRRTN